MKEKNSPRISLITPSFNQASFLEETINSVLSQKYPNLEYIIIDGGSKDGSVDIIKKYEKYLTYWVSEPDSGQSEAIQKGLNKVTGEVFNWLCSDDLLAENALHKISDTFSNPNVQVVSGDVILFGEGMEDRRSKGTQLFTSLSETLIKSYNVQPSTFFKTNFMKRVGINPLLHFYMDRELWIKYLLEYGMEGFEYIPKVLAHYRIHPESKTAKEMDDDMLNPSSKFKIDLNSIFYSLACNKGLYKEAEIIAKLTDSILSHYHFKSLSSLKKSNIKKYVNYYLYNEGLKNFYAGNDSTASMAITCVDFKRLPIRLWRDYFYLKRQIAN